MDIWENGNEIISNSIHSLEKLSKYVLDSIEIELNVQDRDAGIHSEDSIISLIHPEILSLKYCRLLSAMRLPIPRTAKKQAVAPC